MKMNRLKWALLAIVLSSAAVAQAVLKFEVVSDHADCLYRCGEEATVTVKVSDTNGAPAKAGVFTVKLDNFGSRQEWMRKIDLANEPSAEFSFKAKRAQPGFMRFTFASKELVVNNSGKVADRRGNPSHSYVWGLGFSPEKIVQGVRCPDDFDAFWAAAVKKLDDEVPEDAQVTLIEETSKKGPCNLYEVSFATVGGRRIRGFLSVPKAPGRYPVRITVPGAGPGGYGARCEPNAINLQMNVHYYAVVKDRAETDRRYAEQDREWGGKYGVRRYCTSGISESREAYFYYGSLLGINRAVNWLARRPDVDLSDFSYSGSSQGGGFGFYLTGLNRHITHACIFVPAITDLMGSKVDGRQSGWPQIVDSQKPENRAATERFAPYFDAANFAARVTVPVRVVVGFSDTTCPPAAVYAGYNAIPSRDKAIVNSPGMPHSVFERHYRELGEWQRNLIRK